MSKSLYDVIGVLPTATHEEIEAACLRLGQEHNPANNPGDLQAAMRFKEIEHVYEVLGNPEARKQYDTQTDMAASAVPHAEPGRQPPGIEPKRFSVGAAIGVIVLGVLGILVATGSLPIGNRLASDEKAKAAITALKKLSARTETGISYRDYSPALGEAYFPVKQFLESDSAKSNPTFAQAIVSSMKWFGAASGVWEQKIKFSTSHNESVGVCHPKPGDYPSYGVTDLCESYPELTSMVRHPNWILRDNKDNVLGIDFEDAMQKTWNLAGQELRKAEQQMR